MFLLSSFSRCELNAALATRWQRYIAENGHATVPDARAADWIVLASCGFDKMREDRTRALIHHVEDHLLPGQRFLVAGCFPGIAGLGGERGATVFVPFDDHAAVDAIFRTRRPFDEISSTRLDRRFYSPSTLNSGDAYLLIAEGCAFACTYCFIKKAKGGVRSRPIRTVVQEYLAERACGAERFVLLADDAASYGLERGEDVVALLRALRDADAGGSVQIQYFHPGRFVQLFDALLPLLENGFVSRIDIPLQTTSPRLLELMRRRYDPAQVLELVRRAKAAAPAAFFQTQMIAGFPTETGGELLRSAFDALRAFDRVLYFAYEHRQGVECAGLAPVPREELLRRYLFLYQVSWLAPRDAFVCDALPLVRDGRRLRMDEVIDAAGDFLRAFSEDEAPPQPDLRDRELEREWQEHDALVKLAATLEALSPETLRLTGWQLREVREGGQELALEFRREGATARLRVGLDEAGPDLARRPAVRDIALDARRPGRETDAEALRVFVEAVIARLKP